MKTVPQTVRDMPPAVRFLSIIILLQLVLWTMIPALLYTVLPLDALETIAWGSGFSLGNAKHPPLTGWIAGLTAAATGYADWPFYLLSQLCVTGGMVYIYFLAREFLGREESVLAALTPQFIFYYNVTSPEFNVNMPLLAMWPAAALCFVRACRRDRIRDWILLGAVCGLCLLCKYTSMLLFAAFGVYLLLAKERRRLILTAGPWIAAATMSLVILPHAMWAVSGGIAMMETYVEKRMETKVNASWFQQHFLGALTILGNAVMVVLIPLGAFWLSKRERPRLPENSGRREGALFAAVMTFVPLLVMVAVGLSGHAIRAMWLVPLFFPLGILLAAVFPAEWTPKQTRRFRTGVIVFFALCLAGTTIAGLVHSGKRKNFPARRFTAEASRMYTEKTGKPLTVMTGDVSPAGLFRHYAPGHPQGCVWNNSCEVERLGAMLKERGGLAITEKPEHMDGLLETFGVPDTPRFTMDVEYRSLFGKKRSKTLFFAVLDGTPEK